MSVDLSEQDQELVDRARTALAQTSSGQVAAARDVRGETFVAIAVDLPHLRLEALQTLVAMMASAGSAPLSAVAVIGWSPTPEGVAAVRDLGVEAPVWLIDSSGRATGQA